jgi:hypothetical protein
MAIEKTVEQKAEDRVNAALRAIRRVGVLSRGKNALSAEFGEEALCRLKRECDIQYDRFQEQAYFDLAKGPAMLTESEKQRVNDIVRGLRRPWPSLSERDYTEYIETQLAKPGISCEDLRLLCIIYDCDLGDIAATIARDNYKGT